MNFAPSANVPASVIIEVEAKNAVYVRQLEFSAAGPLTGDPLHGDTRPYDHFSHAEP